MAPILRWLFVCELKCYAIGHFRKGWNCTVPRCYSSSELLRRTKEWEEGVTIDLIIEASEHDYQKVIPGASIASFEAEQPRGWRYDMPFRDPLGGSFTEPSAGKISINGQIIYSNTPYGPVWTPVRPDMGAVDLHTMTGFELQEAVLRNITGKQV